MSYQLSKVLIKNFKSCKKTTLNLALYTPFVGYNNAGKSNIIAAIKWFVDGGTLGREFFYDESCPIEVETTINGIDADVISFLTEPNRKKIIPYLDNGKLTMKRVLNKPSGGRSDQSLFLFNYENTEWKKNPSGIDAAIKGILPNVLHVEAMDNSEEDSVKVKSSNTLGQIISLLIEPVESEHGEKIQGALEIVREMLHVEGKDRPSELKQFDEESSSLLDSFFPGLNLQLHIPTPQVSDLFKNSTIRIREGKGLKKFSQLGHGAQRSIQMALLRYLASKRTSEKGKTLLLIDEPELYLHPQAIEHLKAALMDLTHVGFQVLFSTHSPLLICEKTIADTALVRKDKVDGTFSRKRIKDAVEEAIENNQHQAEVIFSLSNSSQVLFCESALLIEGKTEKALLPFLYERKHRATPAQHKLAIISQNGSGSVLKSMKVLNAINLPVKSVVDLDFAFKSNVLNDDNNNIIRCKKIFQENATDIGYLLGNDGFPKNGGSISAAAAYEWLATTAVQEVENLHNELKAKNIWLWKKGTIETHLKLAEKNNLEWSKFKSRIEGTSLDIECRDECLHSLLDWLRNSV
ncbi:AAA family ATPase [Halobacteriovorax sp. XZX-3]|uniref:ATP-dependent nuclease n=1 Tax=unclassified Halobacteriovorax TaxID=2639665 RepID=UPI00371E17F2